MYTFFVGILIGAGAILPGISSGVFCVIFGIYEKLVNSIVNFFSDWKANLKFLLHIILGGIIGIFLFGSALNYLFTNFYSQTCFAIMGLILGSIPSVLKQCKIPKIKIQHVLCLLLSLSFSIFLVAIEYSLHYQVNYDISFADLILSGATMSAGLVIPGVSSTVILMIQGIYETYLNAIASLNLFVLVPMAIGVLIGGFIFLKLIQFLFKRFRSCTYFAITGFVLGSIPVLYPGFSFSLEGLVCLIFFLLGLLVGRFFDHYSNTHEKQRN